MGAGRKEIRGGGRDRRDKEIGGGWVTRLLWVSGILFAWAAVELAFKPWLRAGRKAMRKSLDPDYDVDDELDNESSTNPQQDPVLPAAPADEEQDPPLDSPKKPAAVEYPPL